MSDHLHTQPDEHLEARITAYVLGEASPFESAELEDLISKSPELQLFLNRTRALHSLLKEAETTSNTPAEDWKLPSEKREKLDAIFGSEETIVHLDKESRIRRASFRAVFGIAAIFIITLFTIRLVPWDYEAEAIIEVKPRGRVMEPLSGMLGSNSSQMTATYFGTEFEKIKSRNTLGQVIDELDLTTKWGIDRESALKRLKDSVETKNIRGTDLLSIRVSERDKQDALDITEAVVRNYKEYRTALEDKSLDKGINELKKAVREQEDKVEERRKVLTTISRTKDIVYAGDGTRRGLDVDRAADSSLSEYTRLENEKMQLESQIQSLLSYDSEQLKIYASGLDLPDNAVKTLYPEYLAKKREVEGLKANGLGENHPSIVAQVKQLEQTKEQIDESVVNLRTRLQGQLDLAKDRLATAKVKKDEARKEAVEENIDNQDYADAERDFETEKGLLERMKLKLIASEIDGDISEESIVVHDPATIKRRSVLSLLPFSEDKEEEESFALSDIAPEPTVSAPQAPGRMSAAEAAPQIHIGGQVRTTGPLDFSEGTTLGEAVASAGGATEFGSKKRVKVYRDGKTSTYDLTDDSLANIELQPGDTIEIPQKNWFGCGAGRDELVKSGTTREEPQSEIADLADGLRSGDAGISGKSIDALLNNPERTTDADLKGTMPGLTGTFSFDAPDEEKQAAVADSDFDAFAPDSTVQRKPNAPSEAQTKEIITGADASPVTPSPQREITFGDGDDFGDGWGEENTNVKNSAKGGFLRDLSLASGETTIAEAQKLRKLGKYDESRELLEKAKQSALEDFRIEEELGYLDDPIRTNPAFTEEHSKDVDDLRRKLYTAEGNYELGKYDDALEAYEEALRIDPYNEAARRGMEKVANAKSDYYRAAYDQTRSELLMEVDKAWELDVASEGAGGVVAPPDTYSSSRIPLIKEKSGDPATNPLQFGVDRDFTYPTEFQLPKTANNEDGATPFPVTPATPTDFESLDTAAEEPLPSGTPVVGRLFKAPDINLADLTQEIPATEEPFSTFSLNISDASFQIARAAMEKGEQPDPSAIKPEQFYNAINYGDPAPSSLEPVAASIDQTAHPVIPGRNLVRVALRTASTGRSAAQPLRLTLLVDQSGSMVREDRRAAMETALEQLATLLTENDEVTVIGFSRTPRLLADSLPGDQAEKLPELINQTANEGGTNLEQAITLASELALRHKLDSAQNRIVLFTDGAANLGNADPTRLSESIEALRQQSISFDIAGIGTTDLNDNLLAELARHGNGRYYLVDENTGSSLATQLAGAFRPAAENVKVQVVLNPNRVGNYKLIGFEKDRLKTEDFRNDSVDAAELAADEAGVAMYQVETLPEGSGEIGEVSVRFRDTASGEMVERTWTIPYDPSAPAIDKADQKTQLATLSLLAAQKLQGGPLADAINLRNFSETLARLKQAYAKDEKTTQMLTFIDRLK